MEMVTGRGFFPRWTIFRMGCKEDYFLRYVPLKSVGFEVWKITKTCMGGGKFVKDWRISQSHFQTTGTNDASMQK